MVSGGRYLVRVLLIAAALGLCVGGPGPARAGGTPIGFVSLPARGTLAVYRRVLRAAGGRIEQGIQNRS